MESLISNPTYMRQLESFLIESNRIEGITATPLNLHVKEAHRVMQLDKVTVSDLERFVGVFEPTAVLRRTYGMDVRVGGYYPPPGGANIEVQLTELLRDIDAGLPSYEAHIRYESLHPFTDCNGRSGRMLWAWQEGPFKLGLGFLHAFYYQTLDRSGR